MFYIILCALALTLESITFILCFCPVIVTTDYDIIAGERFYKKYSVIGLTSVESIPTRQVATTYFLFTLTAVIVLAVLLYYSILALKRQNKIAKLIFILSVVPILLMRVCENFNPFEYYSYYFENVNMPVTITINVFSSTIRLCSILTAFISGLSCLSLKPDIKSSLQPLNEPINSDSRKNDKFSDNVISMDQNANMELLIKYHDLLKNGIITQEEFDEKKQDLL